MYRDLPCLEKSLIQPIRQKLSFKLVDNVQSEVIKPTTVQFDPRTYTNTLIVEQNYIIPFLNRQFTRFI